MAVWNREAGTDGEAQGHVIEVTTLGEEKRCQEPFIDICVVVCYFGWLWEEQSERQLVV